MDVHNVVSRSLRMFKQIKRDKRTLGLMIIAPILVTLLFSWAFSGEITNVPIIIYNGDAGLREKASDVIIEVLRDNSNMNITLNDTDAFNKLGKDYHAVIFLSENLTEDLVLSGTAEIYIYINVTTSAEAQILTQYLLNNISEALMNFLNINQTHIEINQTVRLSFQRPPMDFIFNICVLNYDMGFKPILGTLIIENLREKKRSEC